MALFLFNVLAWGSAVVVLGLCGWQSYRMRRVTAGLYVALGLLCLSWMEAPYDRVLFVQFNPALAKFPTDWPILGATQGGLPLMAPSGYIAYFMIPALSAAALFRRLPAPRSDRSLLLLGLGVGIAWDVTVEVFCTQFGVWAFSQTTPGLVLFSGTVAQYPLHVALAMGVQIMGVTYLLGKRDDHGRMPVEQWATRRASRHPVLVTVLATAAYLHLFYIAVAVPALVVKLAGWSTVIADSPVFPGHENQFQTPAASGAPGTALIWTSLLLIAVVAFCRLAQIPFRRRNRAPLSSAAPSQPTP